MTKLTDLTASASELMVRILCDSIPDSSIDGAYLYCATEDNQPSVFMAAKEIFGKGMVRQILILQADSMGGYPGGERWRKALESVGIPSRHILDVPAGGLSSINTLIESREMIRCVKGRGMQHLLVVAPPFQQLRAFMTAVTVALEWYPELKLYSSPGMALPWMDTVIHSQGTLQAPRRQLIKEELVRIETYQKKGDLARFKTVLNYIDERDR